MKMHATVNKLFVMTVCQSMDEMLTDVLTAVIACRVTWGSFDEQIQQVAMFEPECNIGTATRL